MFIITIWLSLTFILIKFTKILKMFVDDVLRSILHISKHNAIIVIFLVFGQTVYIMNDVFDGTFNSKLLKAVTFRMNL